METAPGRLHYFLPLSLYIFRYYYRSFSTFLLFRFRQLIQSKALIERNPGIIILFMYIQRHFLFQEAQMIFTCEALVMSIIMILQR